MGVVALALAFAILAFAIDDGAAFDATQYPDWKGQWMRLGSGQGAPWDPAKPWGAGQQAPLTPNYQALFEANLRDQAAGGQGSDPSYRCIPTGMPRVMIAVQPMEIVITPDTTYVMLELFGTLRRIFTDGRDWPQEFDPTFAGYSIGKWIDEGGSGRYNVHEVETRGFKGPRTYDNTGLSLHEDNQSIIKERLFQDKSDPNILHDEITTIDHALTRPWTATKTYRRVPDARPVWHESVCVENNPHVEIEKQGYMLSADGFLMPAKKDQPPPDLRYFTQSKQ
jgi:hypothetical protein